MTSDISIVAISDLGTKLNVVRQRPALFAADEPPPPSFLDYPVDIIAASQSGTLIVLPLAWIGAFCLLLNSSCLTQRLGYDPFANECGDLECDRGSY
jgi:hypothetical protein